MTQNEVITHFDLSIIDHIVVKYHVLEEYQIYGEKSQCNIR